MNAKHQRIRDALLKGSAVEIETTDPETLVFVENELIEDHLEGSLTPPESELFLANFLVTEERREHLNEVRMLKRFSSDAFEFDASGFDEPSKSVGSSFSRTATVILIVAITAILIFISLKFLRSY
ncbi:MAG: hypothetical protein ABL984_09380 [Pyrinomonadaceae bacterium]